MNSERTFATFRVAGDDLVPDKLTKLLGIDPTLAYAKGQHYRRRSGSPNLTGRTGVWFLSTDNNIKSDRLTDHIEWLLSRLMPVQAKLSRFIDENSLHAVVTCFWHGPRGSLAPIIPKETHDLIEAIPAKLEEDFDSDDRLIVSEQAHVR